jgi:hypothetical protein
MLLGGITSTLTAPRVSRLEQFRPTVLVTVHERLPFLGLAVVACIRRRWRSTSTLIDISLLIWQGLGGGFTANAWQSMIAKIIPSDRLHFLWYPVIER